MFWLTKVSYLQLWTNQETAMINARQVFDTPHVYIMFTKGHHKLHRHY